MNIFDSLKEYAKPRIGRLMYNSEGKTFLYNSRTKEFKDITVYPLEKFRPFISYPFKGYPIHDKEQDEKKEQSQSPFDAIRAYSIKVGEKIIDNDKKDILRYGFINEHGIAITHATYDRVDAFRYGSACVYLNDKICYIDIYGRPKFNGMPFEKAEFIFPEDKGFSMFSTDGKYGLMNKYGYICIPCEYDSMDFRCYSDVSIDDIPIGEIKYVVMRKSGLSYTAIIEGYAICNILNFVPKSIKLRATFLLIEEEFSKEGKTYTKQGLLNRGGNRILKSEYDSIKIEANNIGIVTKEGTTQVLFIGDKGFKIVVDNETNVKYGEAYDEERNEKICYVTLDDKCLKYLISEDKKGLHLMTDCGFWPENTDEFDKIYFSSANKNNSYFAVVVGDKTKLVNIYGGEVIPLVIPSEYRVITDTFAEGIVGVCKKVKTRNTDGNYCEEEQYAYMNSEGKLLTDFIFDEVERFKGGKAMAFQCSPHSSTKCTIDIEGHIINRNTEYDSDCQIQQGDDLAEWRDDAFEGDSEAYWNVD